MNEFSVVGIVNGVSKKTGNSYFMLHLLRDFVPSSSQVKTGQECIVQFVEGICPKDVVVGGRVAFEYTIGTNGYPTVCGVVAV